MLANYFFRRWLQELARAPRSADTGAVMEAPPQFVSAESAVTHAIGSRVVDGRYELLQRVGEGATGIVYRAYDKLLDVQIAVKMLRPEYADNEAALERFRQEIILSRDIGHPNILRTYHLGEFERQKYLTMQWVDGSTLAESITKEAPFPHELCLTIGKKLASALAAAHARKILHRDIKPQNILIDRRHEPYLMDFGVARLLGEPGITSSSIFVGTPNYASPEQAYLLPLDDRSDLYALGVVLFEMATGRRPFTADSSQKVLDLHKVAVPPNPRTIQPSISARLSTVILRCLEKDPAKRYSSAKALCLALEALDPDAQDP